MQDIEHTDWHVVLGVKGKIDDGWDYDVSWQNSIVNLISQAQNYFSTAKIDNALNVITGPAFANGTRIRPRWPECSSHGPLLRCVPYNIFSPGQVTPAALAYLEVPGQFER